MAGSKVGTVFAEIDLDRTKYDRSLQAMLASSQDGTVKIEKAWKNLGAKTDETYTRMKANAVLSWEAIAKSGAASADEIRRAQEAMHRKLDSLNALQFGAHVSLGERIKKNWLEVSAAAASVYGSFRIGQDVINASLQMEQITATIKATAGSGEIAAREFQFVRQESERLGMVLGDASLAYAKFMAATKNTALEGEGAKKVFVGVSEAVAALKLRSEESSGIFLALSQMMSKGKISAEELSGQLGERLPGAVKLTADAMGMSTKELLKHMENGELMSEDVLPRLADQLHKTYGKAAMEAAQGGQAEINRFKNALLETEAAMGDAVMPTFTELLNLIKSAAPTIQAFIGGTKMLAVEVAGAFDKAVASGRAALSSASSVGFYGATLFGAGGPATLEGQIAQIDANVQASKDAIYAQMTRNADVAQSAVAAELSTREKATKKILELTSQANAEILAAKNKTVAGATALMIKEVEGFRRAGVDETAIAEYVAAKKKQIADKYKGEAAKGEKEYWRTESDILSSLTKQNKDFFDTRVSEADQWLAVQKANGINELNYAVDIINRKMFALNDWHNAQADAIVEHTQRESEKQAKLTALDAEYNRKWNEFQNQRAAKEIQVTEFSKQAYSAMLTWERKQLADQIAWERSVQGTRYPVSSDVWEKQYEYFALTGQKTAETNSDLLQLMTDEYKDTFVGGWKAGLLKIQNDQVTWGRTMEATAESIYSNMAGGFSSIFYDTVTGKFTSLEDYTKAFGESVLKSFTDMIGKMAAKRVIAYFTTQWASEGAGVVGVLAKILGMGIDLVKNVDTTPTTTMDYSDMGQIAANGGMAYGGWVGGTPVYAGNSYANDRIPGLFSPGEYVVDREHIAAIAGQGQHGDTMLAHINAAEARLLKTLGGAGTINPRTGLPQFWSLGGFGDALATLLTGGISDSLRGEMPFAGIFDPLIAKFGLQDYAPSSVEEWVNAIKAAASDSDWAQLFDNIFDPTLVTNKALESLGSRLPASIRDIAPTLGTLIGTYIYPVAGTAIGYGIGAHLQGQTSQQAIMGAGTAATAAYVSMIANDLVASETGSVMAGKAAGAVSGAFVRMGLNAVNAGFLSDAVLSAKVKTSMTGFGNTGWLFNMLSDMNGIVGKDYAVSARDGLSYIPRDNYKINAHQGEAVLNKEDAREWRESRGGGDTHHHWHIYGDVVDHDGFARKIIPSINRALKARAH